MVAACRAAAIHEVIEALPEGYDTRIGEDGVRLSAGERQRLAIARALARDAPILILDEPTANLDAETEQRVLDGVLGAAVGRTLLVITHREAVAARIGPRPRALEHLVYLASLPYTGCVPQDQLVVRGAREHNLKDISVSLPRDRLIVITGLSGSGKSSLAFDTIYAEGQRRYVKSLSGVCAPVPGADGEAGRRCHRGPLASHLDRPEGCGSQSPLDGGHGHGDLRPPAPALRPRRTPALPTLRSARSRE